MSDSQANPSSDLTELFCEFLNSLREIDPYAIAELMCTRVPCNKEMADHPTVQVGTEDNTLCTYIRPGTYRLGMLGLINGFCAEHASEGSKRKAVVAAYRKGKLIDFRVITF